MRLEKSKLSNVFIIPSDDRQLQANLIYHHNKVGNAVFTLKPNCVEYLDWNRISLWPSLLTFSSSGKLNIDEHGFGKQTPRMGEDFFLLLQKIEQHCKTNITCDMIDPLVDDVKIDVVHLLRGSRYPHYKTLAKKICERFNAKLISSEMTPFQSDTGDNNIKNALIPVPSACEDRTYENKLKIYPTTYEFDILGVELNLTDKRSGFASFNHNFAERSPDDFLFQQQVNKFLPQESQITNYGGNVRKVGADIRESSRGVYNTLSPRQAAKKFTEIKCAVLFKENDWGGGVVWNSFVSGTPLIVREEYYNKTNLCKLYTKDVHCLVVKTPQEAAEKLLLIDDCQFKFYFDNIRSLNQELVNDEYFQRFYEFVNQIKR